MGVKYTEEDVKTMIKELDEFKNSLKVRLEILKTNIKEREKELEEIKESLKQYGVTEENIEEELTNIEAKINEEYEKFKELKREYNTLNEKR